jgi:hypothetical protein
MSPVLTSFSRSRDHIYSKLLPLTTIIGVCSRADVKIHYIKIDDLHNQHLSKQELFTFANGSRLTVSDDTLSAGDAPDKPSIRTVGGETPAPKQYNRPNACMGPAASTTRFLLHA